MIQDQTQHNAFFGDSFAAHMGTKVANGGAFVIAHDIRLLEELLKRRRAELHGAMYRALIQESPEEAEELARRFGVDLDGDGDPSNDEIVYSLMEEVIHGEDPRVAIERRFVS